MKKKIFIVIALLLIFSVFCGIIYLNNVFLPTKAKKLLADTLTQSLHYNVEIGKIKYSLIRGFIINDIVIYDKTKDKENTLLTVKETSCHILFLPLIKERKIIIPVIHIDSPYLYIRYQKDNNFNFSRVFSLKDKPQDKPGVKLSFFIYKINIFNGSGTFQDEHFEPKFTRTIQDFSMGFNLKPIDKVAFLTQAKIISDKQTITKVSGEGEYGFFSKELNAKISLANLILPEFNPYFRGLPFSIATGAVENGKFELKFKDGLANLKGSLAVKGLALGKGNLNLTGDINIVPELSYDRKKDIFNYQANLQLLQANLTGIQYINKLNNISGDIGLTNDRIWTNNLKLQALDCAFLLNGAIENLINPSLKANLTCEQLNLEKLFSILPSKPKGFNLSGTSKTRIDIEGPINKLPLGIKANLELKDAKIEAALLKDPLKNINGKIDLTTDTLKWTDLSFNYLDTAYTSIGKLASFNAPQLNFTLTSKELDLASDIKIKNDLIKINALTGKYLDSKFNIKGNIDTQDRANPMLDMYAEVNLKPEDAFGFLPPALAENLKKIKPQGILNIKGALKGKAPAYKDWEASLTATAPTFSVYGLKLTEFSIEAAQKNGILKVVPLTASAYSGVISLNFISDLKPALPEYALKFDASRIELAKLKSDTEFKNQDIAGTLSLTADLKGNFNGPDSLKGQGAISVKNGKLWQLNLFKGLGELFLLSDYEKIVFKEASADFVVNDKNISTDNLKLASDQMKLNCQGQLGFDGALGFTVYTEVNKELIRDSSDIRKFTAAILGGLSDALTIKVSGTIQDPKYKIVPVAADLIKNLKDFILGK
ncbi:MAG: AsmA-like C-terminal region-containing protein [Candidatus Omnitrophica bacterium]|nr:AsmA-like C-terminal region-containing protein [Candidatus Omnitrophota bacterium]MDD5592797.1 AsmA-like C-terminal region-containing protein [Candidatus Omnitrophota bacterium]